MSRARQTDFPSTSPAHAGLYWDYMEYTTEHQPVMPDEVTDGLAIKPGGVYADGTLGAGGHSARILQNLTTGLLIGVDRDAWAVETASARLRAYGKRFRALRGNYHDLPALLAEQDIFQADGVLLDLGVSSHQLDTAARGFSYNADGNLDMRMDDRGELTAFDIVNGYTEKRLTEILFAYGEERYAKRIARAIAETRAAEPITTTMRLADIIAASVPAKYRVTGGHPAKRSFQAIRIEVNNELSRLGAALRDLVSLLSPGGRVCVITFHSLEDRIVKQLFKALANPCECPRDIPVCVCGKTPLVNIVTRKPILPSEKELADNKRSRSAKLRVAERAGLL